MYWTGRMAERAEMAARTALVALTRVAGAAPDRPGPRRRGAGAALGQRRDRAGDRRGRGPRVADLDAEVRRALRGRPGAVVQSLRATVANARTARQLLSARTWSLLTVLDVGASALDDAGRLLGGPGRDDPDDDVVDAPAPGLEPGSGDLVTAPGALTMATFDVTEALDRVLVALAALAGLANETVVRGPGWRFFDIGRRLERALLVLGLVEALFEPAVDSDALAVRGEIALAANESLVAYRRRHRTDVTLDALGDLLLADRDNPRSVRFQLDGLALDLHDLPDRSARRAQLAAVRSRPAPARGPAAPRLGRPATTGSDRSAPSSSPSVNRFSRLATSCPRGWFSERPRRVR